MQKEESQELTEKLDHDWKNIQALMVKKIPRAERVEEEKPKVHFPTGTNKRYLVLKMYVSP